MAATGPVPKKTTLLIREELFVIFDVFVVVEGLEIAFFVKEEEGVFVVLDVVDEENAI